MVPDYYAMLGVDPSADRPTIESALARCQPAWSSGTRNPKTKHTFQSYLDQIPALRQALLGDPMARAAYDAERAASRRAERDRLLDALQKLLRLRAAKGGLTPSDRALLRAEAVKLGLTAEDLDRLAGPIPAAAEAPAEVDPPDPPLDVIDPATRRQIRSALAHLRKRDLYEVLDALRDAPAAELAARADAERQRWMQKSQVTAEKTAWLEAISYAQSHLTAAEARARYDRTLAVEAEEALNAAISFAIEGTARLDPGTRQILIDEAAALGIGPDRASRLIGRACRARGVAQDGSQNGPTPLGPPRLLRCRACSGVTAFAEAAKAGGSPSCRHCGASLQWDCPVCRRTRWVDEPRCACGFPLASREPLIQHFEAAQHAHKARDYATALAHLRRVQEFAPRHVGARKGVEKVQERLAEIDRARVAFEAERARGHLASARKAVEAWALLVDPASPEVRAARADVAAKLRDASALAARGQALAATDPPAARDLLRRALLLASDLPEAREALAQCPPDPPRALRASIEADKVLLRWSAPAQDGLGPVGYRVVRKRDGIPSQLSDGVVVGDVAVAEIEDAGVVPGSSVGYAVFSRRGGVESLNGATTGPVLMLGEVSDVRVEAKSREVHLSWARPRNAIGVRVVRRRGEQPQGPDDGEPIEVAGDEAHDLGLEDDRAYHYGLFALYRGNNGRPLVSRGAFASAVPHPPVEGVGGLTLATDPEGSVRIRWERPARGQVRILRTSEPIRQRPGERLTPAEAEAIGGLWLDAVAPDATIDPTPPPVGVCHYTPMTAWGGALTVGIGAAYSCLTDPSDLRAVRAGTNGRVHLRWRWGPQGGQSLLVSKAGSPPIGPDDPDARPVVVQEAEYSRQGYMAVNLPPDAPGPWHFRVFAVANVQGRRVVSPGLEPTSRTVVPGPNPEVTVIYHLRKPGFPGRPWSVAFRTEPPGAAIPPTALVAHARTVPLSVDDGEVVDRFPASRDGSTFRVRPGVNLSDRRARVFADPHAGPEGLPPIRLRHPEAGPTRA